MGFLSEGTTLDWEEANQKPIDLVKKHGVIQFLIQYHKLKDRKKDCLRWGDEIEYIILYFDDEKKSVKLSLRGHEVLNILSKDENENPKHLWRPEYAKYMIEGTPGSPYGGSGTYGRINDLAFVEKSMKDRRKTIQLNLLKNEKIVSITNFPHLGCIDYGSYTEPPFEPGGPISLSLFTPDEIIHPHFRFKTLTANIRKRRGSKVEINVPLFKDKNTSDKPLPIPEIKNSFINKENISIPFSLNLPFNYSIPKPKPFNIYMDSMTFGMGCCCLQCTFQCCNINEARYFYDQLAVLSPIMLAMTAATPIFRGYLADTDVRWYVISASVDDRTEEERGLKPLKNNKFLINKSRYDSIDCFISTDSRLKSEYNDLDLVYDKEIFQQLTDGGVDILLARHIAHLFIRDPLVIYKDKLLIDDFNYTDHFENIQSTNWQTVRFKPPPPNSDIGWRVEFRPMEIQLTDFENAAFCCFIVLITRIISSLELNFYIPISKVDENMKIAHKRNAIINEKFYFRKNLKGKKSDELQLELMTINEIMNGKTDDENFIGLIKMIKIYLDTINISKETRKIVENYLNFLSKRASGELITPATWIRNFVQNHPEYKQDSIVTPKINYDLMKTIDQIGSEQLYPMDLLGNFSNTKEMIINI
jgi:glutamate--cysteine ligase catalytic subunit